MNEYQQFIHKSRYARWLDDKQRRETWEETVDRYFNFFEAKKMLQAEYEEVRQAVLDREVMPSMRALMTAGPALARDHVAGYNCSYLAIHRVRAFDELMYILLCGSGVGFSVERQYIKKLPKVEDDFYDTDTVINVRDSKIGWATATRELIAMLYIGQVPKWDLSKVRPAGARLKTFGGRASGPEPLDGLFRRLVITFKKAAGRQLNSLECHDICCYIADAVVVGGVRRSALISLSNLSDQRMAAAKNGAWYEDEGQRANSNNSVAYTEKPDAGIFMKEWLNLYESRSGERGIFNRTAAKNQASKSGRRECDHEFGTNPCSEIILRDRQFCNLTEVVVRPTDGLEELKRKVRYATILGTLQSTLTDFRYISSVWKKNCEEERLLGVSLTGIMDHVKMSDPSSCKEWLSNLKDEAIKVNEEFARDYGINASTSITCVKPSGTVSQLVGCSSGIHPAQFQYYYRTVRNANTDPITQFLIDQGVKHEPDVSGKPNTIFYFPIKAPEGALTTEDVTALEQLELWKVYQEEWCEHKPSCTIYVREHEWMEVGAWVYKHFDDVAGVSFFPLSDHIYEQAPYIPLTKEEYEKAVDAVPPVDWSKFGSDYESDDNTTSSQEFACVANQCELI